MMKTKITLILIALVIGLTTSFGQQDEECMNNLNIFNTSAQNKKYDDAYEPWMKVRAKCPGFNEAVYAKTRGKGGQDILLYKIENSTGTEQVNFIKDLLKLYEEYGQYFASKFSVGEMLESKGNLSYDYKKELGLTNQDIYTIFDEAYTKDLENFTNPRGLYIYFKMMVEIYDQGKKTPQQLFDKYDDVTGKIEFEVSKTTTKLNVLLEKEAAGTVLSEKEGQFKGQHESYLKVYNQISEGVDAEIGNRATCEVLIPLYQKDYEANKNDAKWLQRAMDKMYAKECADDPMFKKLVEQKNAIQPDADTAYFLGKLNEDQGNKSEAEKFYAQSMNLQTDPLKKWSLVFRMAERNKKRGAYGKARQQYREALQLNPSNGLPHVRIATMYANSANDCGDTQFNKQAVFWLAAEEVRKAGRIDGRLKNSADQYVANYEGKAPSRSQIFSASNSGSVIRIGCWIGASVTVP